MKNLVLVLAAALVPGVAGAGDVKTDFDKGYDFGKVKTFSAKLATSWGNPLGEKRVMEEITGALTAKGWKEAPEGQADALVMIHGASEKKQTLNTFYSGTGMGGYGYRGWGGMGMGMGTATTTASDYVEGTLVVDVFDAKSKALTFRGTATDELSNKPEKNQKKLEKVTDKMFKNFPPGSEKK